MENKTFFSDNVVKYITNEMKICIKDLTQKIYSDIPQNCDFFNNLFKHMMSLEVPCEYEDELRSNNNDDNREYINKSLYKFLESNGLTEDSDEHFIFDNIRHAFINFKQGGILNMYQYREAEVWYPKVILDCCLGENSDIAQLENNIKIFRGTSTEEYNSNNFGQSWSLSKDIAEEFAFVHYSSQPDYQDTERVVLETIINKSDIFYYTKNEREEEVIINSKNLNNVQIIKKEIIE